jgi:hypothetical protein
MKKKPLFLSFAVAALLAALAGVVQSGGGLQEQTSKPVRPGSHHVLTNAFRAPNVPTNAPVLAHWKLHVPAAPRYYHRPKSQSPTWRGWVANFPTGCGDTGTFSCVVTTNNITELNFQYGFRGHVDPCPVEGVAGGGGDKGGAAVPVEPEPLPPWLVDGKTTNSYFVLPSYTNVCLNGRVTFSAWNDQGEPVASTWTTAPSGLTPTSQTSGVAAVTYSATAPGQYTIKGVSDQDPSLADSATADVIKVEIKALDEPAALLCVGGTRRFKAEVTPQVQGVFVWSVNHPDKLGFVGGNRTAETIAVTGLVASAAVNAEELKVEFTPTAATFTCTATTNLTVIKVDIMSENGLDDPMQSIGLEDIEKYKAVTTPAVSGTISWSTSSSRLTLTDASSQIVSVRAGSSASSSVGAEPLQLHFTPSGSSVVCLASHSISVVKVDRFEPDTALEIDDGDGDPDTRLFVINRADWPPSTVIRATPYPNITGMALPGSWGMRTLEGTASGFGRLEREVSTLLASKTVIKCWSGASQKWTTVYVVECKFTALANYELGWDPNTLVGHAWWRLDIKPESARNDVLEKIVPAYGALVNDEGGFYPVTVGDPFDLGKVVRGPQPISGGPDINTATSQHDWDITFLQLVAGLSDVDAWYLAPGNYHAATRNCVYGVCRVGSVCGVSIPAFSPTFWHPKQLQSWLNSL